MDTLLIALGHRSRQGKDTAAAAILAAFPREIKIYGFADALYSLCRVQGMRGKDGRRLQDVGEAFRQNGRVDVAGVPVETHHRFWVDLLLDRIATERPPVALITDMRHVEEAESCQIRIKVTRFHEDGTPWLVTDRDPNHISEVALADYGGWTYHLRNAGSREGLERKAVALYSAIRTTTGVAS